jgi:hypothetical protein
MSSQKNMRWLWQADKIFMGAVLIVCAAAVISFWRPDAAEPDAAGAPMRASMNLYHIKMPSLDPRVPDLGVDVATDPHEYLPRPGEHVCISPDCSYIMPDGTIWCPACKTRQDDRDRDGMDDAWEGRYAATNPDVPDGDLDPDDDLFTNLEEYIGGSNPDDPNSKPAAIRLVAVGQELVDVLFRGFLERADGTRAIQLNWGADTRTQILELGAPFRGYTLVRVGERLVRRGDPEHGIPYYTETEYDLVLERPGGGELVLPRGTYVKEPERYGVFVSKDDGPPGRPRERARAYAGMTFKIGGHSYVVVEVSPTSAHLIGDRGEHYHLELRPE